MMGGSPDLDISVGQAACGLVVVTVVALLPIGLAAVGLYYLVMVVRWIWAV